MEKTKEKHPLYESYRELFENPWCPLFGELIYPNENTPPSSQIGRCIKIIIESRKLWEVSPFELDLYRLNENSWPEPEDIPDYPKALIEAAREIQDQSSNIVQHATGWLYPDSHEFPYLPTDRKYYQTLDSSTETTIEYARQFCKKIEDIPDFKILAVLAIDEAYFTLDLMIRDGKSEDYPLVRECEQDAENLLAKAKELLAEEDIKEAREDISAAERTIEGMQHDAEHGRKFSNGPKQPRQDVLSREIEKTYIKLLKHNKKDPSAKEVWKSLSTGKDIQEIDDEIIYWKNSRNSDKKTFFKSFQHRLTNIKKKNKK